MMNAPQGSKEKLVLNSAHHTLMRMISEHTEENLKARDKSVWECNSIEFAD